MFAFRDSRGRVEVAFTDRHGGLSEGPWSSLNLGTSNGDDPVCVRSNFAALANGFGVAPERMARMSQVHGTEVRVLDRVPADVPVADALVTTVADVTLVVRAADCVPVLLADAETGLVAAVHAGRRGLQSGVVPATVAVLRGLGADVVSGWLGPRICGRCYEVPAWLQAEVIAAAPDAAATTSWGTPSLDIGAGVAAQLRAEGIAVVDVAAVRPVCTYERPDLFSYRRQGQRSGRLAGTVRLAS